MKRQQNQQSRFRRSSRVADEALGVGCGVDSRSGFERSKAVLDEEGVSGISGSRRLRRGPRIRKCPEGASAGLLCDVLVA